MLAVYNKYTEEKIGEVPLVSADALPTYIRYAQEAKRFFASLSGEARYKLLAKFSEKILAHQSECISLIVQEAGKPITLAEAEYFRGITTLRIAQEESLRLSGEVVPMDYGIGQGKQAFTGRFPIGIVLGITPFNFPFNLSLHKIAPALAVGCPIIIKPSPFTPLIAGLLEKLALEAGYPKGCLQVVSCENDVAEQLVRHPDIAMLSFTGSDSIGWKLKELCGKKKVCLELGGNAAAIIDATADIALASWECAYSSNAYAGQTCISTQRIYVVESVWETFLLALVEATRAIASGNPEDSHIHNSSIISLTHANRVHQWVEEAIAGGAQLLIGGNFIQKEHRIYQPTLLTGVPPYSKLVTEEAFGPVAIVEKVLDIDSAIHQVNTSRYGLQAALFTRDIQSMKRCFAGVEVGALIVNQSSGFRLDGMPYGGVKDSGMGREGVRYTMHEMTEMRLCVY